MVHDGVDYYFRKANGKGTGLAQGSSHCNFASGERWELMDLLKAIYLDRPIQAGRQAAYSPGSYQQPY
jgi:hypothetical protein